MRKLLYLILCVGICSLAFHVIHFVTFLPDIVLPLKVYRSGRFENKPGQTVDIDKEKTFVPQTLRPRHGDRYKRTHYWTFFFESQTSLNQRWEIKLENKSDAKISDGVRIEAVFSGNGEEEKKVLLDFGREENGKTLEIKETGKYDRLTLFALPGPPGHKVNADAVLVDVKSMLACGGQNPLYLNLGAGAIFGVFVFLAIMFFRTNYGRNHWPAVVVAVACGALAFGLALYNGGGWKSHLGMPSVILQASTFFFYGGLAYFFIGFFRKTDKVFLVHFVLWTLFFTILLSLAYPGFNNADMGHLLKMYMSGHYHSTVVWGSAYVFLTPLLLSINEKYATCSIALLLLTTAIVSFIAQELYTISRSRAVLFLYNIVLVTSLPFLFNTLYHYRTSYFSVLLILFCFLVFQKLIDRKAETWKSMLSMAVLMHLLIMFRIDILPVIPLACVILAMASSQKKIKVFLGYCVLLLVVSPMHYHFQTQNEFVSLRDRTKSLYPVVGFILDNKHFDRNPEETKTVMEKVVDLEKLRHYSRDMSYPYTSNIFCGKFQNSEEGVRNLKEAQRVGIRLCLDNPSLWLTRKFYVFLMGCGMSPREYARYHTNLARRNIKNDTKAVWERDYLEAVSRKIVPGHVPKSYDKIVFWIHWTEKNGPFPSHRLIFWNRLPAFLLLVFIVLLYPFVPASSIISLLFLARLPLIFLIDPFGLFQVTLGEYTAGLMMPAIALSEYCYRKRVKNGDDTTELDSDSALRSQRYGIFMTTALVIYVFLFFFFTQMSS